MRAMRPAASDAQPSQVMVNGSTHVLRFSGHIHHLIHIVRVWLATSPFACMYTLYDPAPDLFLGRVLGDGELNSSPRASVVYKGVNVACKVWLSPNCSNSQRPGGKKRVGHRTESSGPILQALGRWMQDGELKRTKHGLAAYRDRDTLRHAGHKMPPILLVHIALPSTLSIYSSHAIVRYVARSIGPYANAALNRIVGLCVDVFDQHRAALISLHRCASMNSIYPCELVVQPR